MDDGYRLKVEALGEILGLTCYYDKYSFVEFEVTVKKRQVLSVTKSDENATCAISAQVANNRKRVTVSSVLLLYNPS